MEAPTGSTRECSTANRQARPIGAGGEERERIDPPVTIIRPVLTRRAFLAGLGAAAAARTRPLGAARDDIVIKGGPVIDPAQHLDRVADVAIQGGRVRLVQPDIAIGDAADVIDARGRLVTPGLIDLHVHVGAPDLTPAALLADGVTSMVDGGSAGADNID